MAPDLTQHLAKLRRADDLIAARMLGVRRGAEVEHRSKAIGTCARADLVPDLGGFF
jgi:hypothetical protein